MSRARSSTGMAGESAAFRMLARSRSNTWTPAADNPHADVPCQRLELGMGGGGGGRGGLNSLTSTLLRLQPACWFSVSITAVGYKMVWTYRG